MGFESVKKIAEADFPTRWGAFRILGFEGRLKAARPCEEGPADGAGKGKVEGLVALVMGDIHSAPPVVRIHSQCLTGDVFGSLRCDCRLQLELAMRMIAEAGAGILLYEQQADAVKGAALVNFLWWAVNDGQQYTDALQYAPLPAGAVTLDEQLLNKVTSNGKPLHTGS